MKIALTNEMKKFITVAEMPAVRRIINDFKNSEDTVTEYAKMAARIATDGYVEKVLECSAEIAKNCRVWNLFDDESRDLDVWISFTAYTSKGFVIGGAYISDLWGAYGDNYDEIRSHMFIRMFTETK